MFGLRIRSRASRAVRLQWGFYFSLMSPMNHVNRHLSFLRATAIGGIFFLLPLVVVCFLLGQIGQLVYAVALQIQPILRDWLGIRGATGYVLVFAIAVSVIVLLCFVAGILASRSIARQFTLSIEKYLLMLFPRYAIFKEQLSGNIGGEIAKNRLKPVCVQLDGYTRLGFEVERTENEIPEPGRTVGTHPNNSQRGNSELGNTEQAAGEGSLHIERVTVFLPGSPDPWSGTVINVSPDRVRAIHAPFPDVLGAFEKLGHDSQKILRGESIRT